MSGIQQILLSTVIWIQAIKDSSFCAFFWVSLLSNKKQDYFTSSLKIKIEIAPSMHELDQLMIDSMYLLDPQKVNTLTDSERSMFKLNCYQLIGEAKHGNKDFVICQSAKGKLFCFDKEAFLNLYKVSSNLLLSKSANS